ncbi:MAG: arylsulfatase A-like enzyme [Planctomycetota bacterium]|jgi:arylsulfatase A-like enzyme
MFDTNWTACALLALSSSLPAQAATQADERPNIVFAIADDWGWPHAGAYGDVAVQTPHFDRVAEMGVLFENAYVSSPSCTPSRGAIVTGQHFFRLGAGASLWCEWPEDRFPEYPAMLSDAGYHVGSWRKSWGPGKGAPGGAKFKNVDAFFDARGDDQPFCLWLGASDPHRGYEKDSGAKSGIDLDQVHMFPQFPDAPEVRGDVADYYFEVQRFDRDVGRLLTRLEEMGELDNTLFVVTGDHGMPFPRCKGNVYDSGARVPLAVAWPSRIPAGRRVTDFVSLTDMAPTFLEAAGLSVPTEITGRSLMPTLRSTHEGRVEAHRDHVVVGRERHVPCQEAPEREGYPVRALRTDSYLYIRNAHPDRWPAGTPNHELCTSRNSWLGDCDNGPTKLYLWEHRADDDVRSLFDLCFAKRPAEELYDLRVDPEQVHNIAAEEIHQAALAELSKRLDAELRRARDPRALGMEEVLEGHKYLGGGGGKWPFK